MIEPSQLRALAEAATQPGPWRAREDVTPSGVEYVVVDRDGMWVALCGRDPEQAALIAALSPSIVLELLDRLEAAKANLARMTEVAVSRASIATLSELRTRIGRLSIAPNLPDGVWRELCLLDSDMAEMGVPSNVGKEQA